MQPSRFKVGDRVRYNTFVAVVVEVLLLNSQWFYNLSDQVGGDVFFAAIPEADLREF